MIGRTHVSEGGDQEEGGGGGGGEREEKQAFDLLRSVDAYRELDVLVGVMLGERERFAPCAWLYDSIIQVWPIGQIEISGETRISSHLFDLPVFYFITFI